MLKGSCHCGAVSFELSQLPQSLMDCNCSVCRRIGALWGHVAIDAVTVSAPENGMVEYIHGDRMLAFNTCKTCGCTTHWSNLLEDGLPLDRYRDIIGCAQLTLTGKPQGHEQVCRCHIDSAAECC